MDPSTGVIIGLAIALGITLIWAISAQVRLSKLTLPTPPTPSVPSALIEFLQTWFGLTPYVFFFAGFIIDALNSQYMYSKASLVGAVTVILTSMFGSDTFAKWAENIVGFIPKVYTPFAGVPPPDASWMSQFSIVGILSWLVIAGIVFLPMMIGRLSGWAWGSSTALAGLFILIALAGNGLLGTSVAQPQFLLVPGRASTYAGITNNNPCVTPGLETFQSRFAPAGIILSTSILSAHMFEAIDTQNHNTAIAAGTLAGLSFAIEYAIMMAKGCFTQYKYQGYAPFISLAIGYGAGAAAYYTMKQTGQESFTTQTGGIFHPQQIPSKAKKTDGEKISTKIVVGPPEETSEPVDDQDAFVCEAYKDGELVTSTLVE